MKLRARHILATLGLCGLLVLSCNVFVARQGKALVVPPSVAQTADCILVLGAGVWGTEPSPVLEDRLQTALSLYQQGKAPRILVSGDHGRPGYDEPTTMARWLEARGVPAAHIFLDHAGFDTNSSIVRAHRVFGAGSVIVVTQAFHLPRAAYLAQAEGMRAQGVAADLRPYAGSTWFSAREVISRTRAVLDGTVGRTPKHLGPRFDLRGDGRATRAS
jgi:SanA protein